MSEKRPFLTLTMLAVLLLAFGLRTWNLSDAPPGWRDDELINSLVISQKVLDGDWAVYYPDASGHEALYHALNAGMLGLFGANALGIRLLSAILGTLTVAVTFQVGRRLFNWQTGLIAATVLAVSFWSLMYSRIGLRHVTIPPLMGLAVLYFWQGIRQSASASSMGWPQLRPFFQGSLFAALGIYTYFAARGAPLIFVAFTLFLAIVYGSLLRRCWPGILLFLGATAVLSMPLVYTLSQQPESEARVAELAVPIIEAQQGNLTVLIDYIRITLSMFHATGDPEWLYNIPDRPVFVGGLSALFWLGVLVAAGLAIRLLLARFGQRPLTPQARWWGLSGGFLFAWWLAGISPGFISVPPASLGHVILSLTPTYLLLALPIGWLLAHRPRWSKTAVFVSLLLLTTAAAWRDLPDYFQTWPERGMVRFLYRADIHDVAVYVNQSDLTDFGVSGLLAGPWDKIALEIDLNREARPRWFDPRRAVLLEPSVSFTNFPNVPFAFPEAATPLANQPSVGGYELADVAVSFTPLSPVCFGNGLCAISAMYDPETAVLTLGWQVEQGVELPPNPLISNPPPPGVYAGPRLAVFAQLVDEQSQFISGDDGLWVDPYTLQPGDLFLQQHWLIKRGDGAETAVLFGLYDPMTGQRWLTEEGEDHVRIELE